MRILKTVKEYGSNSIGTSNTTLETQTIKALGDVIAWQIWTQFDIDDSGDDSADYLSDGGTPSGSFKGTNAARYFDTISLKDNNNTDLFVSTRNDLHIMAYLMSLVDVHDFMTKRGVDVEDTTIIADATNDTHNFIVPQSISVSDLPATIEITLGVLADQFSTVSDGTSTIDQLAVVVRYMPPKESSITLRIKAFNITSFSSNQDVSHLIPNAIRIHVLAYLPASPNGQSAPSEMVNTRVDRITFRRGSNEEIEGQRRTVLDAYIDERYENNRPTGLTVIPSDSFEKTDATFWEFRVSAAVAPRVYYVYSIA